MPVQRVASHVIRIGRERGPELVASAFFAYVWPPLEKEIKKRISVLIRDWANGSESQPARAKTSRRKAPVKAKAPAKKPIKKAPAKRPVRKALPKKK
jgi:hypothetical protein